MDESNLFVFSFNFSWQLNWQQTACQFNAFQFNNYITLHSLAFHFEFNLVKFCLQEKKSIFRFYALKQCKYTRIFVHKNVNTYTYTKMKYEF